MAQGNPLGVTLAARALAEHSRNNLTLAPSGQEEDTTVDTDAVEADAADLYAYIETRGFHFPRELVTRYLLALLTKPFALFTGISGTGKTKLALLTAEFYAARPGTRARRWERPVDGDHEFYLPIDAVTLRSGTITPSSDQLDYFNVPPGATETFTVSITNILGAHGDITFRATNLVADGRKHLTLQVPSTVRRAFEETGVTERDYLRFEIVEEFKRYRVSLFRPGSEEVDVPAEDRYEFISVRPNWSDHTALLGTFNSHYERYERTPVVELLLRAAREERDARAAGVKPAPYFLVFDEMNLARIEHYFSDFLSALESRRRDHDGTIRQEPLHLHRVDAARLLWVDHVGIEYEIPERLEIPTNVLFTGTLNLDESTYGLSAKVVDRANTIAFSAVDFAGFLRGAEGSDDGSPLELSAEATASIELGTFALAEASDSRAVAKELEPFVQLNELLVRHDQHYGYRVLNDVAFYVRSAQQLVGDSPEVLHAAVDACVLQKVVPKFYGWKQDRGGMLRDLLSFCVEGSAMPTMREIQVDANDRAVCIDGSTPYLPRAAGRLARMLGAMG
ncbi:MAG: 5-methylcytosine-specific restriction related enzyme [Thermoleophilia bacterium]|nr:5-methylcytosine-specific restriction related enzyme [Thermoleophilia bacterium]MCZ4495662.1 5-methylcytosine-specific restriction related enzyme [Thermoleophilia bacterium]